DKLNQAGNRDTRDKSRFLNTLIARKAFSWTQVFAELEKLMPARVHVVSIRPDFTANNQLQIHLEAIGDTREKANDLVRQLEKSPAFRAPQVREEKDDPGQGNNNQSGGVQFVIVADYVPELDKPQAESKPQPESKADQKGGE
ncbi:MAG: PilN domain-containing protein, partial [Acidobacteriaceae bacterium]|nr:PilN domain-containing protein [Acidobacteriaceae bacterium]